MLHSQTHKRTNQEEDCYENDKSEDETVDGGDDTMDGKAVQETELEQEPPLTQKANWITWYMKNPLNKRVGRETANEQALREYEKENMKRRGGGRKRRMGEKAQEACRGGVGRVLRLSTRLSH